jgi:translation elongation factor EF-G
MIFAVNKLDKDDADFDRAVAEAKNHFGSKVAGGSIPAAARRRLSRNN